MLVIKIDHVHTEPAQTCFTCFADVIRFPADAAVMRPFRIAYNSKFRCDDDVLAVQAERAPNQLFVGVRPVDVGNRLIERDERLQGGTADRGEKSFKISEFDRLPTQPAANVDRHEEEADHPRRAAR